jgi:hypothetical protein
MLKNSFITSKENGVRRGKFGGSILFAVEDIEQK